MVGGGVLAISENPAWEAGTFDYKRCAELHNILVEQAWAAEGRSLEELERRSFFQYYGDKANEIVDRLDPSLRAFLESAIVGQELPSFFIWVSGIGSPTEMFFVEDMFLECGEPNRFLVLYVTQRDLGGHPLGLIYDQKLHRATLTLGLEDIWAIKPVEQHDDLWHPLETVLGHWIHLVEIKKVTASQDEAPNEKYGPWIWHTYSEAQVDSTVAAFEHLVDTIEERMPVGHLLNLTEAPLLNHAQLDAASVPRSCFIRSFLTRLRRPRFKMIAPGLEIPHDPAVFISNQKFTVMDADSEYGVVIPPVLIFASAERLAVDFDRTSRYRGFNPFCRAFELPQGDRSIISGLYSESVERFDIDNAEEGFRLLLPFRFRAPGQDHGAKKSDGSFVDDESVAELFQHGCKPFGGEWWRAQRLEVLFNHWSHLIQTGVWAIGKDGVQGGIDVFKDADAHLSDEYRIRPSW
ncbi:hypothetical protein EKO27_g4639 [Xylaria grammica]|uniref:Uncharacterized protein n=1 Tax=Xylaria grammica TaxID=363999 RepID=A0A439D7U5_9PEZI|nr:hypothetical protein EKO27_g4639 [Xylaria grammica]